MVSGNKIEKKKRKGGGRGGGRVYRPSSPSNVTRRLEQCRNKNQESGRRRPHTISTWTGRSDRVLVCESARSGCQGGGGARGREKRQHTRLSHRLRCDMQCPIGCLPSANLNPAGLHGSNGLFGGSKCSFLLSTTRASEASDRGK